MSKWKKRGPVLGLLLVGVTAAVYAAGMPAAERQQQLPPGVADLAKVSRIEVSQDGTMVLAGDFGAEIDDGDEIKREATLTGSGSARGEAEVELDAADRTRQELEVEVEGLTARTTYQVTADGQVAGTITTDVRGKGSVELARNTNAQ